MPKRRAGGEVVHVSKNTISVEAPPHENLVALTGRQIWVHGGAEKLKSDSMEYTPQAFKEIYDLLVVHLRHDRIVPVDSRCTCDAANFFDKFKQECYEVCGCGVEASMREMLHMRASDTMPLQFY